MMRYFRTFPAITSSGKELRNIVSNIRLASDVLSQYESFYPYTIRDGQSPDFLAWKYYGDPNYDWLIFLCNNIIDPYHQWPLSEGDFRNYLEVKYDVSIYTLMTRVSHYVFNGADGNTGEEIARVDWKMSTSTHDLLTAEERDGWVPVYVYDVEFDANEAKRQIRLLSREYLPQVTAEFANIFRNG